MSANIYKRTSKEKISYIRDHGYWVRECSSSSRVNYIIVDPKGDESGFIVAGDDQVLNDTIDRILKF